MSGHLFHGTRSGPDFSASGRLPEPERGEPARDYRCCRHRQINRVGYKEPEGFVSHKAAEPIGPGDLGWQAKRLGELYLPDDRVLTAHAPLERMDAELDATAFVEFK